jgi:hypothetical protein
MEAVARQTALKAVSAASNGNVGAPTGPIRSGRFPCRHLPERCVPQNVTSPLCVRTKQLVVSPALLIGDTCGIDRRVDRPKQTAFKLAFPAPKAAVEQDLLDQHLQQSENRSGTKFERRDQFRRITHFPPNQRTFDATRQGGDQCSRVARAVQHRPGSDVQRFGAND